VYNTYIVEGFGAFLGENAFLGHHGVNSAVIDSLAANGYGHICFWSQENHWSFFSDPDNLYGHNR